MNSKVLVFGMDGNVLDNYKIKSTSAGEALQENAEKYFNIKKDVEYFVNIYVQTSGMNSLEQFKIAYLTVADVNQITHDIIEATEKLFRQKLQEVEKNISIYSDVKEFIKSLDKNIFHLVITTTVPITSISTLAKHTGVDNLFEVVCARNGVWTKDKTINIEGFDKGSQHFDYLKKHFKIQKENMIAFSSTTKDIQNALDYKIVSIAVEHIHNKETLEKLNPSYIIPDFYRAKDLLESILNKH